MKKTNKILVALVTVTALLLTNTIGVLALQSFTDVGDGHWAKEYIEKMESKQVVAGYPDATFKPAENVSKLAAITMIFRTIKAAGKLENVNLNSLLQRYSMVLHRFNIPTRYSWAEEAVAFALEEDILEEYELQGFFKPDGTLENVKRAEVSVFLGKALNNYLKEDLRGNIIVFGFNDTDFISTTAAPYVDLLVKKDIVSGDENNNFNPNKPINRAGAAKMFSLAYDILDDIKIDLEDEDEDEEYDERELSTEEGKIVVVVEDNNSIVVEDDDGDKNIYKIEDDTEILIGGRRADIDDLKEKQEIELFLDDDNVVVKVEVGQSLSDSDAEIYNVIDMGRYYLITFRDSDNNKRTYKTDDDTLIELNDKTADADELERGDTVTFTVDGETLVEVLVESKTRVYEGILESSVVFRNYPRMELKTSNKRIIELEVDEDASVRRNGRKRDLMDLVKGDVITATVEDDKVVKIVATSIDEDDEGVITEIILGSQNKITILNDDGIERTYTLAPDVDIEIDNDDAEISDLKVDYKVELEIESELVTDIEAEKVEISNSMNGVITKIHKDFDAITIKVVENNGTEHYTVLADDADIMTVSGRDRRFRDLDEDDEVFVYGEDKSEIFDFVADKIIIIKSK
ncbi:S-layer homology domain-containing protein [Maledivibacter halophilus]|uniref:S-layer homology domain-containing protein n=1 Tax=Maledivibacter halophilus TaxID=36842 RepID=A0A1T5JZC6_9FIRM|nr:S-layer homology domain-containing protein [Maledivibacter halophilus]SKC56680.1 S-layer homology domain-containing protein [Maledivibacter halophilus]